MSWATIKGYEGVYAVSDDGQVMAMNYANSGLPGLMNPSPRRGYLSVFFRKPGIKARWFTVHSLVASAFIGKRPSGHQINHKNGIKTDNRVANLEYCTQSENTRHSFRIGLQSNQGDNHSQAKLNDEKVIDIRRRLLNGESQSSVAKAVGVTPSCISRISSGELWPHVSLAGKVG